MSNLVTKSRLNYFATKLWNNKIKPINTSLNNHINSNHVPANSIRRWNAKIKLKTWSRVISFENGLSTGHNGILTIRGTRFNVVYNMTLLVNTSHNRLGNIIQLNNVNYANLNIRLISSAGGDGYIEIYDDNEVDNSDMQTLEMSFVNLTDKPFTLYESLSTPSIPNGFKETCKIKTVSNGCVVANSFAGLNGPDFLGLARRNVFFGHQNTTKECYSLTIDNAHMASDAPGYINFLNKDGSLSNLYARFSTPSLKISNTRSINNIETWNSLKGLSAVKMNDDSISLINNNSYNKTSQMYEGVNINEVVSVLVETVKELKNEIDLLKKG